MPLNVLIADGGSTKTEWNLLSAMGNRTVFTQGISPYFMDSHVITEVLRQELMPTIPDTRDIVEVFYYGTGCTAPAMNNIVKSALDVLFPSSQVYIDYDLAAAAHALCDRRAGIACILGTGSNSCYYNGERIVANSPGLGYILGDEGSGAYLGKKLVSEYLYGKLSKGLEAELESTYNTNKDELLHAVYTAALPNRFLASFSPFLSAHRDDPQIENIITQALNDFFEIHISGYSECHSVPVHFTGGVAWAYRDLITVLCERHQMKVGKILKEPMQDLVAYYREHMKYL